MLRETQAKGALTLSLLTQGLWLRQYRASRAGAVSDCSLASLSRIQDIQILGLDELVCSVYLPYAPFRNTTHNYHACTYTGFLGRSEGEPGADASSILFGPYTVFHSPQDMVSWEFQSVVVAVEVPIVAGV